MSYTGKEWSRIQVEENGKPQFCWCNITLYHLLNTAIKGMTISKLNKDEEIKKVSTDFITINDLKLSKGTKVNVKFLVSLKEDYYNLYPEKLLSELNNIDVREIFNKIVELFDNYAYALDTDIDNVIIELTEIRELSKEE